MKWVLPGAVIWLGGWLVGLICWFGLPKDPAGWFAVGALIFCTLLALIAAIVTWRY